ncbi:ciliary microtubule inner protein 2B [Heteronotia binoei]|uniref:ciliary microtubule inner protein 2B n=1 Tax=Heteronotia binoei TaxID=13085 RepID=UPI00292E0B22|nr:ciliary microtubule inner protein 2B [Heteronotia binoei]
MALAPPRHASPSLTTPQPHYLPGYRGHCPRLKFTLGETYGKLTSQLLSSPEGPCHGQLLLQSTWIPPAYRGLVEEEAGEGPGANASFFSSCTIPGYTGFIPRAQNHFAKTYGQVCKEAQQEFARQLARGAGERRACQAARTPPQDAKPEFDLPPAEEKLPVATPAPPGPSCAPHREPDAAAEGGEPQKSFVPGFTGFIPRARYLIGASYPSLTRRAWAEFRQMLRKEGQETSWESSARWKGNGQVLPPLVKTYPADKGLLPHYQGYVPGYKFRFGHTYGHLTYDALGRSTPEKLTLPDRLL